MIIFPAGVGSFSNLSRDKFLDKHSVNLDGSNDYIEISDHDDFSFGNGTTDSSFSISAWAKLDSAAFQRFILKVIPPMRNGYSAHQAKASLPSHCMITLEVLITIKYRRQPFPQGSGITLWEHMTEVH